METWQQELQQSINTASQLKTYWTQMDEKTEKEIDAITTRFPMSIPRHYLSLIGKFDASDPIFRMAVPQGHELSLAEGSFDTSGEESNTKEIGLQHKYGPTALVLSTQSCAMYCRHCFRKRFVGLTVEEIAKMDDEIFLYIQAHQEITNVLISGGDAFLNSDERLESMLKRLDGISHVRSVRFGTRTPVTFPERILLDEALTDLLSRYRNRFGLYVVTQYNHPVEICDKSLEAIRKLQEAGCVINNQTVLMKDINDDSDTLSRLFIGLTEQNIIPYYLFQCRPVKGVLKQFQVPIVEAYPIVKACRSRLGGLSKRFRYVMSHITGKIEIVTVDANGNAVMKYHQAKEKKDEERVFTHHFAPSDCWL